MKFKSFDENFFLNVFKLQNMCMTFIKHAVLGELLN